MHGQFMADLMANRDGGSRIRHLGVHRKKAKRNPKIRFELCTDNRTKILIIPS